MKRATYAIPNRSGFGSRSPSRTPQTYSKPPGKTRFLGPESGFFAFFYAHCAFFLRVMRVLRIRAAREALIPREAKFGTFQPSIAGKIRLYVQLFTWRIDMNFRDQFDVAYAWFRHFREGMSAERAYYATLQTVEVHPDVGMALHTAAGGRANVRALRHSRLNRAAQHRQQGDLAGARHFLRLMRA